jgi:glycosyltransferase involved in cell wall biosynthesis
VIIPTYNRPLHLKRAVESVLNQQGVNLESIEILVIDDGSEIPVSGSFASHPSVRVHRIDHLGKAGQVRNVGLGLAKGEIVAYLDSDDRWEPGHLRQILRVFRRHQETGVVITGFRFERLRVRDGRIEVVPEKPFHPQRVIITDAVAHRRMCFDRLGGFPDLDFQEDYYYWRRLMDHFPTRRIRAKTAVYSFTEGGDNVSFNVSTELADRYR